MTNFKAGTFATETIRNAGVWFNAGSPGTPDYELLGSTVDGLTFAPNTEWDESEVDGQMNAIEGEARIIRERPTITGTLRMFDPDLLTQLLPGATQEVGEGLSSVGDITPADGGAFLVAADYVDQLLVVRQLGDDRYLRLVFPRALVRIGDVTWPTGNEKGSFGFTAVAVQTLAAAQTDMYTRAWLWTYASVPYPGAS